LAKCAIGNREKEKRGGEILRYRTERENGRCGTRGFVGTVLSRGGGAVEEQGGAEAKGTGCCVASTSVFLASKPVRLK